MSSSFLHTPIEYLKGVGPKRGELLRKHLKIFSFGDLLAYYPFKYIDRSKFYPIASINSEQTFIQVRGKITGIELVGKGRGQRFVASLYDGTAVVDLVWFQGIKWIREKLVLHKEYVVYGRPARFGSKYSIAHPEIELLSEFRVNAIGGLQPYYSSTEALKSKYIDSKFIAKLTKTLLLQAEGKLDETLSDAIIRKWNFPSREQAIKNIHHPKDTSSLNGAIARLKFEELFFIQLHLFKTKKLRFNKNIGQRFTKVGDLFNTFFHNNLPFPLTGAQKRVMKEIRFDTNTGHQMNRLLQGDVGSGKTIVALMCMLLAADNGFQSCIMAPTEILATQHYETIKDLLGEMDVHIELLTGSVRKAKRTQIHSDLLSGACKILIGTHAVLEDIVQFKNLGFVIIDEQHRFGVAQRARLWKKNSIIPHVLVMTATPIPRTLAMTLYGDLDVSVIDELPPGRKPIQTYHYFDSHRLRVFGFIRKQIDEGRQAYVVYPLIQESEKLDLKDLQDGYESISREFPLPDYAISIVHGKMKAEDKDFEMQRFARGETQIMVATTVIEVGVNVPNASVMIIENAERFGLSQLHQLRGRVGRGADQSYCILMTGYKLSADGKKRIETMTSTNDGFKIAEVDLEIRGPGNLEGTQQSGILDLQIADVVKDEKILKIARETAREIIEKDPTLTAKENFKLRNEYLRQGEKKTHWGMIS